MPSRYETFGMVAAEAMACGTPVLAFDIPCLREVLPPECGVLVPAFDVGAFATALAELAGDAARCAAMGEAGRDAARRFDWEPLARRQEEVYLDAVRDGRGGPNPRLPSVASSAVLGPALAGLSRAGRARVLLFGNYGNGNLGDEAILARLVQVASGHCDLTVVARNPERVRQLHGVEAVRTTSAKALLAYLRSDVLAIGGGGIFGYGMPPLPRLLPAVAILGRLLGKRTAYLAIGAYDGMPALVRVLLRLSARLSGLVSVRDAESYRTLDVRLGGRAKPLLVTDPGAELAPASEADAAAALRALGVPTDPPPLGVSLKPTPSPELNELAVRALAGAIDWWCEHRTGDVVFFALSHRGDYGLGEELSDLTLAGRLAERVRHPERLYVVGPNFHPAALKGAIGLTAAVVALRLHAQIFAWATGRPLLGLSFERKSDTFLGEAGAARLALGDITTDDIVCWLQGLGE
jgi:polysaccharide pyruvyl transferase WcaK-like protein